MKILFLTCASVLLPLSNSLIAQPFADIATFSYQTFSSTYKNKNSYPEKNKTDDYVLNFFLPKEFKNGNILLVRLNSEYIYSSMIPSSGYALASVSLPIGFQFVGKNVKWKTVVMAVPKIASDFRDRVDKHDCQLGGIFLQNYVYSNRLKIKAGLYYNREAFGNFFVPLVGIDWQATSRINFYGILPTNYKIEFNLKKEKLYAGLNFKSLTRSFRLSQRENQDYVRYDEMQIKFFCDYFVYKKLLLFAEAGYALGKSPLQYTRNTKEQTFANPIFTPVQQRFIFNVGIAYRMRFDFVK